MISSSDLLFIEPAGAASSEPVIDDATRRMAAALRQAQVTGQKWLGWHRCACGARSGSRDLRLPDGQVTNSLCVHYLAHHRSEVPSKQLLRAEALSFGEVEPTLREIASPKLPRLTGIEGWMAYKSQQPNGHRDLRGADLSEFDFAGEDIRHFDCSGADLSRAKLEGCNLQGAKLSGATLSGSRLVEVELQGANLRGAILREADLRRAKLQGANLQRGDLGRARLCGADLENAGLEEADLCWAELQGAKLTRARLVAANFSFADLSGADLRFADLRMSDLTGAMLSGADLEHVILFDADLPAGDSGVVGDEMDEAEHGPHWTGETEWPKGFLESRGLPVERPTPIGE